MEAVESVTILQPQPAPVDDFHGPEFASFYRPSRRNHESVLCTSCGKELSLNAIEEICKHPALEVIVCKNCSNFYHAGKFTQDEEGMDEHCKWCGEGGNLIMCDFCTHSFCNYCIKRNFSVEVFRQIRDAPEWQCFMCDKSQILDKIKKCKNVMKKLEKCTESQVQNENSQESLFTSLAENIKCLDDLLAPMENQMPLSDSNNINRNYMNGQKKKVDPIKLRREKENYVVQRRSASCDEESPAKCESKTFSDPESNRSPFRHSFIKVEDNDEAFSALYNCFQQSTKSDNNNPTHTNMAADEQNPEPTATIHYFPEHASLDEEDMVKSPEHASSDEKEMIKNPEHASLDEEDRVRSPIPSHYKDINPSIDDSSNVATIKKNIGRRTKPQNCEKDDSQNLTEISKPKHSVMAATMNRSPTTTKSKMKEAEKCLERLAVIMDEITHDELTPSTENNNSHTASPAQYSRYKATRNLLKKVKTATSKLKQIEQDLRVRETNLKTFRVSENVHDTSSSDDDSISSSFSKINRQKSIVKSVTPYKQSGASSENESIISVEMEQKSEKDGTILSLDESVKQQLNNHNSVLSNADETIKELKNVKVVLKRLTEEDILEYCKTTTNNEKGSDSELDTDSSKNMRPCKNINHTLTATSLDSESDENSWPKFDPFIKPKIVKSGKLRRMQMLRKKELEACRKKKVHLSDDDDSDYEIENDEYFSDSECDEDGMDFQGDNDDNEIAKQMLLQKMQDEDSNDSDSDVDNLLQKDSNVKKSRNEKCGNTSNNEKDEDIAPKSDANKTEQDKKHGYTHPLLSKKWKVKSDGDDSPEKKNMEESKIENEKPEVQDKKRKHSEDSDVSAKKPRRKLKMSDNSDLALTTDSDAEISTRKVVKQDKKSRRVLSESDSNSSFSEPIVIAESDDYVTCNDSDEETENLPPKRRRRLIEKSDSDGDGEPADDDILNSSQKRGRKNIRKILEDDEVSQSTQQASLEEKERRRRLEKEREGSEEKEEIIVIDKESQTPVKKKVTVRLILSKFPLVEVHRQLVQKMKPHQVEGVRFIWDNIIEKVKDADVKRGNGCILAHCMGLGKTLQTVAFLHTVLMSKHLPTLRTALVLCPFGTINNWVAEFKKWIPLSSLSEYEYKFQKLPVFDLRSDKTDSDRASRLRRWHKQGGIMIMGYGLYRTILSDQRRKTRTSTEDFVEKLSNPGPDILVCDEGHILKNAVSKVASVVQDIHTRRRIVLTGTPLQNNMIEYHCMVSVVKPKLLGTLKEFKNRFMNPIENGQHVDSTDSDAKLMKKRAHVLHELLAGCVQRKDYSCLRAHLPPKYEYVLKVRLSDLQIRMYEYYLNLYTPADANLKKGCIFKDFNRLLLLVCHPRCLVMSTERKESKENQDDIRKFINDEEEIAESEEDDSSDDSVIMISDDEVPCSQVPKPKTLEDIHGLSGAKLRSFIEDRSGRKPDTRNRKKLVNLAAKYLDVNFCKTEEFEKSLKSKSISELKSMIVEHKGSIKGCTEKSDLVNLLKRLILNENKDEEEWYVKFMPSQENLAQSISHSGKIMLLLQILQVSTETGDKVVLFSQSLLTLDLIEEVLKTETKEVCNGLKSENGPYSRWYQNKDYYRLDGSTPGNLRDQWISKFNSKSNPRGRLFLISTRAGGIGINLIGANRAIVFDSSWNPSHDIQSIFRIYRFGQVKPCYVYRFVAQGTMEEKIYERQVIKQSLAFRVVDEQQILRHFSSSDVNELYQFKPAPKPKKKTNHDTDNVPDFAPPKDTLLASILKSTDHVVTYHEHDSLLNHQVSEELTEAERRAAWEEYDNEQKNPAVSTKTDEIFKSFTPYYLSMFSDNAREILESINKKISQVQQSSIGRLFSEIQMANRTMDTETVSKLAMQKKLDQHILLRRLTSLQKVLEAYHLGVKRVILQKRSITLPPFQPRSFLNTTNASNNTNSSKPRPQFAPHFGGTNRYSSNFSSYPSTSNSSRHSGPHATRTSRPTVPNMGSRNATTRTRFTAPPPRPTAPPPRNSYSSSSNNAGQGVNYNPPHSFSANQTRPPRYRPNYTTVHQSYRSNHRPNSDSRNRGSMNFQTYYTVPGTRR